MKELLKLISTIFILFNFTLVAAQSNVDFLKEWKQVAALEAKGLTQDALTQVIDIFEMALTANNQPQQIKSAMYQMKYRNMVQEDNQETNIFYVDSLINKTKVPAKNILQSMQAELFASYLNNHRYELYDRTELVAEKSTDITTWSIEKINNASKILYKASLQEKLILQNTPIDAFAAILTEGKNTRLLRPTLFDFLAHRALDHFISAEEVLPSRAANKFIINDEKAFSPIEEFVQHSFNATDTNSLFLDALQLLQQILIFHKNDASKDALLDADLIRLEFVNNQAVFTNQEKLYENALLQIEQNYPTSSYAGLAMYLRAKQLQESGNTYGAENMQQQFDLNKALEIAKTVQEKYPGTEAANKSNNLIIDILKPTLEVTTEKVNIPNEPFRGLVSYRNVPKLHFRLIKTSRTEMESIVKDHPDSLWNALISMPTSQSWSEVLPDTKDHQIHRTEIKIDALPIGSYILLSSIQANFRLTNNILTSQMLYISNISYIENNEKNMYVLHRKSGQPLSNATVQVWENEYDYDSRKNIANPGEKFRTDVNGLASLELNQNKYNTNLQFLYKNDELFTADNYYHYQYNSYETTKKNKTFLFTDRSIYRPGQTLFFKGIVLSKDDSLQTNQVIANYKTTLLLFNSNGEKVAAIHVTSNEFGSFTGNFILPTGSLNGSFSIRDSISYDTKEFSVEEYKRPKFITTIEKSAGTYRINDTILVKGKADAYAGNTINDAKVSYRVVRKMRFPIWWGWGSYVKIMPPYGNNSSIEIANGFTTTDVDGNFEIKFKAIPDEKINKKDLVTFYYEVSTDVTDINGETRSAFNIVAVAYHALELNIQLAERMPSSDLNKIQIFSTNLNGIFEKTNVQLELHSLDQPKKIFRERFWATPDQFIMSKTSYEALFPFDEYANEADPAGWAIKKKEMTVSDTTSKNGSFGLRYKTLKPGFYKIIATAIDQFGEKVRAEKIIAIFDPKKPSLQEAFVLDVKKATALPGESLLYNMHTGFTNIWLINHVRKMDQTTSVNYLKLTKKKVIQKIIPVTEKDRGGVALHYMFVMNNRFYSGSSSFAIPWNNKEVKVTYETFRDKLLPGNNEEWKLKISGANSDKVAAELLVSMYDASLDQFRSHNWENLRSVWPTLNYYFNWRSTNFTSGFSDEKKHWTNDYTTIAEKNYDVLLNEGWNIGLYNYNLYNRNMVDESGVVMMDSATGAAPAHP
ncbi:MAG: MG2 domain-containing protein, partial [Ferruginibacter sp.]